MLEKRACTLQDNDELFLKLFEHTAVPSRVLSDCWSWSQGGALTQHPWGLGVPQEGSRSGGTPDIAVSNIVAVAATFSGDVSIAGTVSYEDVSEVNAVGIITAQSGIDVTGRDINITSGGVNAAGVITATEYDGYLFLDNQLF